LAHTWYGRNGKTMWGKYSSSKTTTEKLCDV